jgi:hypothetical protein
MLWEAAGENSSQIVNFASAEYQSFGNMCVRSYGKNYRDPFRSDYGSAFTCSFSLASTGRENVRTILTGVLSAI